MRLIILESPFRGRDQTEQDRFRRYRQHCIRDAIERGESPYASHAIIPGALDDSIPAERQRGIEAGYAWWDAAEAIVFYLDHGMSTGMQYAFDRALARQYNIEERRLIHERGRKLPCKIYCGRAVCYIDYDRFRCAKSTAPEQKM